MTPEWNVYSSFVRRGIVTDECLGYFLETSAGFWPDREMVSFADTHYSYSQIHRWSIAIAQMLVAEGCRPGNRVLIQATNSVELLVLQFAVWRIGAVTVPVVPMYRAHELKAIIADVSPQVVVTSGDIGSRRFTTDIDTILAEMRHEPTLRVVLQSMETRPANWIECPAFPEAAQSTSEAGLPEPAPSQDCAVILYTSGSTAAPKGAMLRGTAVVNNARTLQKCVGISNNDVSLCATPIGHTGALIIGAIVPMTVGARCVVLPSWKPDEAIETIAREKVTFMGAPPLILQDLVERYEAGQSAGHRIQKFTTGGGAVPPSLIMRADAVGIRASRNYGMTETTGNIAACAYSCDIERRAHFDGYPEYGSEIEIVNGERQPLPRGSIGEIRIRSPLNMIGYTDPLITAAQMDAEGWLYTGDLGKLDEDGWLTVEGRLKDIINRGGEKFSSQDIEAAIACHADVTDVAVVGAPDARYGEVVAAFVRLKPGKIWAGPDDLLAHLEAIKLAKQKWPVRWVVVDDFPRTPSGKVQKQALREIVRNAQ